MPASAAPPTAPQPAPSGASAPPSGNLALAASQPRPQPRPEAPVPSAQPGVRLGRFEDLVALAGEKREIGLKAALERDVRVVRFEDGRLEFALAEGASTTLANELSRALLAWTGQRWVVALSSEPGAPTLHERAQDTAKQRKEGAAAHPLVQAVLTKFPGAQIVDVRDRAAAKDEEEAEPAGVPEAPPEPDADEDF
jgi:DNA polymerase III subunit gamma/tau